MGRPSSCACCCTRKRVTPVTLKALDNGTGVTQWEYGPGALWAQHYGLDRISGAKIDWVANDRYVVAAGEGYWQGTVLYPLAKRHPITGSLTPTASECVTLIKLNSVDGTVVESAQMTGVFIAGEVSQGSLVGLFPVNLTQMQSPVGLSGGGYLLPCSIDPAVEWVDYTTNTANKEYVLHAHTLQGGNVYIRTRTSAEIITIPHAATATAVKALFERTQDCVACFSSGGPWPNAPISIAVTWSTPTGDIGGLMFDEKYTAGGAGTCLFEWHASTSTWVLVSDSCATGVGDPPIGSGAYDGELRAGTCPVPIPPRPSGRRNTRAAAVSWSTSTGSATSSVGRVFGLGAGITPIKLIPDNNASPPVYSLISSSTIHNDMYAGPGNSVVLFATGGADGRTVEAWTVGPQWSRIWQRYTNGEPLYGGRCAWAAGLSQAGRLSIYVKRRAYTGGLKCGVIANIIAGTFTSFDESEITISTQYDANAATGMLLDSSGTDLLTFDYPRVYNPATDPSARIAYNLGGSQFKTPSTRLLLGNLSPVLGVDATRIYASVYATTMTATPFTWSSEGRVERPPSGGLATASSISRTYVWKWYTSPTERYDAGEFRLVFTPTAQTGLPQKMTTWLDWQCAPGDIEAAVLAIWPQNTEGVVTNVAVNPLNAGGTNVTDNQPPPGLFETNLTVFFRAANSLGFIPPEYVGPGQVSIEARSLATVPNTGGVAAYSVTDASVTWARNYGSTANPPKTVARPIGGWLRGTRLYVYGSVVDSEL